MKQSWGTSQLLRTAAACILLALSAGILQAQHLVNTGTFTNNSGGTIKVQGTLTAGQTSLGGTVEFYGTTQTVPAITYTHLKATGSSGSKTFAGSTIVTGDITVNQTSGGFVLAATDTLELQKITTVPVTVTSGSFDVSAGTTKYATGAQVIYGTTYKNLIAAGGNKTTSGTITVASGGTLTNSVTTDFGANAFVGTGATFANSGTLQSAGTVTLGSGTSVNGTFSYYSTGAQSIADATYSGTLNVSGTGAKTVGNVIVSGTYSAAGGARTYDGTFTYNAAGAQSVAGEDYDSLALSGSGTKTFAATTTVGAALTSTVPVTVTGSVTLGSNAVATLSDNLSVDGTFNADASGATVNFNGAAQTISGTAGTMNVTNLTLSGSAAKTSSLGLNVDGIFTPTRGIDMGASAVLNITNPAANAVGTYGSLEQVKGTMKRAVNTNGSFYTFNDSATGATFAGATITDFSLKVEPGVNPTGYTASTHANRKVTASYTGWSAGTATIALGYTNGEKPSQDENKLRFFKGNSTTKLSTGSAAVRVAASSSSWGSVSLAGVTSTLLPSSTELIMANSGAALITLANAADWNTPGTWDEGYVPTANDDVEINHTGITISGNAFASTLQINAAKSLTVDGANLTVSGNATNNGTLTVSASRQLQVGSSGTGTLNNTGTVTNNGTVVVGN
jgi:hypothetical protein